jgi:gluconokinase
MLPSQFEALDEPSDAITVDVSLPPTAIVRQIVTQLQASKEARRC